MKHLVFGATSMVGELIGDHLTQRGETAFGVSRHPGRTAVTADLTKLETLAGLTPVDIIFCAAKVVILAPAVGQLLQSCNPKRMVILSSTSVFTKTDSSDESERASISQLVDAEQTIIEQCRSANVESTVLRPTLIYKEGRDNNVTQIARLVRRLGFMPLYGSAAGLRQPVHAEDMALGAIAAALSPVAANKVYSTAGLETISYREMAGRVFDGLSRKRRLVSLPPMLWKAAFALAKPIYPKVTAAMGERMMKDMAFDSTVAERDFGWTTRPFAPVF